MTAEKKDRLPYRLREPFLSKTEAALFRLLGELMGSRYVICPKVALTDLFMIVRPNAVSYTHLHCGPGKWWLDPRH